MKFAGSPKMNSTRYGGHPPASPGNYAPSVKRAAGLKFSDQGRPAPGPLSRGGGSCRRVKISRPHPGAPGTPKMPPGSHSGRHVRPDQIGIPWPRPGTQKTQASGFESRFFFSALPIYPDPEPTEPQERQDRQPVRVFVGDVGVSFPEPASNLVAPAPGVLDERDDIG